MGKSKNPHINYTFGDRFQRFIKKIADFAVNKKSKRDVDSGPDGIFDGEYGELITKYGENIFYRKNNQTEFVNLSDEYPEYIAQHRYVLSQGVNKNATWTKTSDLGYKKWSLNGYFSLIADVDCCATGAFSSI